MSKNVKQLAIEYLDSIQRIEMMRGLCGMSGFYGLETSRVDAHKELCRALEISEDRTKEICGHLDRYIGFDQQAIESGYEANQDKYAEALIEILTALKEEQP